MALDLSDKNWLEALVASELERADPDAARERLPEEVRARLGDGAPADHRELDPAAALLVSRSLRQRRLRPTPEETFEDAVRGHVQLALDLALAADRARDTDARRAEIASALAAAAGAPGAALAADPAAAPKPRAIVAALRSAAQALVDRHFPPADPVGGLPLFPGGLAATRRHLARVAMARLRAGRLERDALATGAGLTERELVLLAEALSGAIGPPPDRRAERVRRKQLARLGLSRRALAAARSAVSRPRPGAALGVASPEPVRAFLLEQLALAQLRTNGAVASYVDAFASAAGFAPEAVAAARVEAAAQHGDHLQWVEAVATGEWQAFADALEERTDLVVDRVTAAVTENLGALATELRQTGELGQLLARAAAGQKLTEEERRKVKAQLIDVAKAVPALAIFAAPGGALLLPLLAKLLPFSILPSAWDKPKAAPPAPTKALPEQAASDSEPLAKAAKTGSGEG